MHASGFAIAAGVLSAGLVSHGAVAQSLDAPDPPAAPLVVIGPAAKTLTAKPAASAFAAVQPAPALPRLYLNNEAGDGSAAAVMNKNTRDFGVWVTDPRLVAGIGLTPAFALETGFVNLYDRGSYFASYAHPEQTAGALGVNGFDSYLAGKYTVALNDRLQVVGKAGVAYSRFDQRDVHLGSMTSTDIGPYARLGAQYKLNDKMSVSGNVERYGDSAKWGPANSNNTGVSAKVNLGF